jgi:hypothetical protein
MHRKCHSALGPGASSQLVHPEWQTKYLLASNICTNGDPDRSEHRANIIVFFEGMSGHFLRGVWWIVWPTFYDDDRCSYSA